MAINIQSWLKKIETDLLEFDNITFNNEGEKQNFIRGLTRWLSEISIKNFLIKKFISFCL